MFLFYNARLAPYAFLVSCFVLELFLVGLSHQPTLPFVGIGYMLCLMKFATPVSLHVCALILISMSGMLQGFALGGLLIFWLLNAFIIVNFRFLLYSSRLIHLAVIGGIVVIFVLLYGIKAWTIWNFFGILSVLPVMVHNFV
jgi:hypothetical protein